MSDAPDMSWKKADLLEHAESEGVEADSSMTKQEILDAITGGSETPQAKTGIVEYSEEYYALPWAERYALSQSLKKQ